MKDRSYLESNGVNVAKSLELFGDMETYNDTLQEFINDISEKKENLQKYKETSDMANYAIIAHSVKSDSKYFGFDHLAELALNHEMAGKQNNMFYVCENFQEFINEIEKMTKIAKIYIGLPVVEEEKILTAKFEKILVVDDSAVIKKFINTIFNYKYEVLEAKDGDEAFNILENNKISTMLLDLNMPNVNGFQVLDYLNRNNLFDKIKVTIITGVASDDVINKAKSYPIKGIILKPFNERDIKNAVEKAEEIDII